MNAHVSNGTQRFKSSMVGTDHLNKLYYIVVVDVPAERAYVVSSDVEGTLAKLCPCCMIADHREKLAEILTRLYVSKEIRGLVRWCSDHGADIEIGRIGDCCKPLQAAYFVDVPAHLASDEMRRFVRADIRRRISCVRARKTAAA